MICFNVVARAERRIGAGDDQASHGGIAHRIFELSVSRGRQSIARLGGGAE